MCLRLAMQFATVACLESLLVLASLPLAFVADMRLALKNSHHPWWNTWASWPVTMTSAYRVTTEPASSLTEHLHTLRTLARTWDTGNLMSDIKSHVVNCEGAKASRSKASFCLMDRLKRFYCNGNQCFLRVGRCSEHKSSTCLALVR